MARHTLQQILNEITPAEQAHALGLTYGGFGGWINADRQVVARTIDGKLVKVTDDPEGDDVPDKGRITILAFEDTILHSKPENSSEKDNRYVSRFHTIIKAVVKKGGEFTILCNRGSERRLAEYLRGIGLKAGLKIVPLGAFDSNKIREFVEKKIKEGFSSIHYFDTDEKNIHAVESLKAPYNKLEINIKAHLLTKMDRPHGNSSTSSSADTER